MSPSGGAQGRDFARPDPATRLPTMAKKRRNAPQKCIAKPATSTEGSALSQNCDILPWKFHIFEDAQGRSDVQGAIDRLPERSLARFEAIVRHLAAEPREEWRRPQAAKLTGHVDLFEIRFNDGNTPCRPTGFFGPTPGVFTITLFVTKNRNGYHPANAFDIADHRRRLVVAGEARTVALQVYGEDFPPVRE